ncbi:P-loop containing nucleoside triphosphate hydrolase protein [Flagelloscypha sp. PMI_526]|nr:P-loop containing nucleoside triphosphate hydrolase protein [Flagelloscypha sp. PMI_526]
MLSEARQPSPKHRTVHKPQAFGLATPRELVEYLDQYIIGQETAKKVLSVALYNHYNRVRLNDSYHAELRRESQNYVDPHSGVESAQVRPLRPKRPSIGRLPIPESFIEKSNVLLIGPTGSGKTLLARTLSQVLDVPFSVSDATAFTQAGYVGENVEVIIHRLLHSANWDPERASMGICYIDEVDKIARKGAGGSGPDSARDIGGEGVQQALLRMMEGTTISINAPSQNPGLPPAFEPPSQPPSRAHQKTSEYAPRPEVYHVDTSNILFILSGAFVGLENIVKSRVSKGSIGFGASLKSDTPPPSKGMPFFSANKTAVDNPLGMVETQDLIKYGLIPEFMGRLPAIATLSPLKIGDLRRILSSVKGSLMSQYTALFDYSGVEIQFTQGAQVEICRLAMERGGGARGLRSIMENLLLEPMYAVPGSDITHVLIDENVVRGQRPASYWRAEESARFWQAFAEQEQVFNELHKDDDHF